MPGEKSDGSGKCKMNKTSLKIRKCQVRLEEDK